MARAGEEMADRKVVIGHAVEVMTLKWDGARRAMSYSWKFEDRGRGEPSTEDLIDMATALRAAAKEVERQAMSND